ncbi:unnamed protein product [Triticum turgidum subsp. durum]|uniref:Uncharacterized protein n=1 Tax=Triticum turgidum subsp. durum TaxID=4567 RepID=A0A9R0T6M2_TRITD|nr:unnamed protein product [Triticum turgidum subsp. durum]
MAGVGADGGGDTEMGGWSELLNTSTKLLEQAAPTPHFPTLQRGTWTSSRCSPRSLRPRRSAPRRRRSRSPPPGLLAREGINAEQLTRDLKSFELKTTFEDVFPSMAIVSSIQGAQKDNLKSFNNYMMQVLEQSLSRLSTLPKRNTNLAGGLSRYALMPSSASSPQASSGLPAAEVMPIPNKTIIDSKSSVYAGVVKDLNDARGRSLPFSFQSCLRVLVS